MVVNFVDAAKTTRMLEMVLASVDYVQRSSRLFSATNGITKMAAFLRKRKFSTLDSVLLVAGNVQLEPTGAQAVVDAIKRMADGIVVIVDEDCPRRAGLRAIRGFVRSTHTCRHSPRPPLLGSWQRCERL